MATARRIDGGEPATTPLAELYHADETAWLERMARLVAERKSDQLDWDNLSEYLDDMAKRERREVGSRLRVLLGHMLKWDYQPKKRSRSWETTILEQRIELQQILDSATLRNHAAAVLADVYRSAAKLAAVETGLPKDQFPADCPYTLDQILADE